MTTPPPADATATGVTSDRLADLRRWNVALTVLHVVQAVGVVALASNFAITVTSSFPTGPPGSDVPPPEALFDVPIGSAIAVFLTLAALDHLITATIGRNTYERDLRRGINRFRWVEYSTKPAWSCVDHDAGVLVRNARWSRAMGRSHGQPRGRG